MITNRIILPIVILLTILLGGCSVGAVDGKTAEEWKILYELKNKELEALNKSINVKKDEEYQKWLNELRIECTSEKNEQLNKIQKILNQCTTEECVKNIQDGSLNNIMPSTNYVSDCIKRKKNEVNESE